ncbi:MAG: pimeloyl-ACP methyl ester carboxylesterase [Parvibaculaceae bacterium]|mgnify:CR=1 FL=1|jgi:pimeloyl-ACP methyl ester carboxylesterase
MRKWITIVGGTLVALGALTFLVILPSQVIKGNNSAMSETPADRGLTFEEFTLTSRTDDISLAGWWIPAKDPKGIFLFIHGANGSKEGPYLESLNLYRDMVNAGYTVVAPDLRNHGTSGRSASGSLMFGLEEKDDVLAVIDMITERAPELPLYAGGVSMGGGTLVHTLAEETPIRAALLWDPLLDAASSSAGGVKAMLDLPDIFIGPVIWSAQNFFGLPSESAIELGKSLTTPILLIQDEEDPVTLAKFSQELADENDNVRMIVMPTPELPNALLTENDGWATHGAAYELYPTEFVDHLTTFLENH